MDELDGYPKNLYRAQCDSDTSTDTDCGPGITTPSTTHASLQSGSYSTPPKTGQSYMIIEKRSNGAVTAKEEAVYLETLHEVVGSPFNTWLLVQRQNYKGFFNETTGRYLGVGSRELTGDKQVFAQARYHKKNEFFTIEHKKDEFYQLLMPDGGESLLVVSVADKTSLVRRQDGTTVFKFIEV
ncbi:hypothetical protein F5Y18DRAFT_440317 [Xylariaceae sp. FL1019]|nr:hypothetical protein F5Y18DRAFT_440317 [Xylariaceae sp. FL1019]